MHHRSTFPPSPLDRRFQYLSRRLAVAANLCHPSQIAHLGSPERHDEIRRALALPAVTPLVCTIAHNKRITSMSTDTNYVGPVRLAFGACMT